MARSQTGPATKGLGSQIDLVETIAMKVFKIFIFAILQFLNARKQYHPFIERAATVWKQARIRHWHHWRSAQISRRGKRRSGKCDSRSHFQRKSQSQK
jgi:hypothetical protein